MAMENYHRILKLWAYLNRIYYPSVEAKADGTKTTLEIFSTAGICLKDGTQKKMQGSHLELAQKTKIFHGYKLFMQPLKKELIAEHIIVLQK